MVIKLPSLCCSLKCCLDPNNNRNNDMAQCTLSRLGNSSNSRKLLWPKHECGLAQLLWLMKKSRPAKDLSCNMWRG